MFPPSPQSPSPFAPPPPPAPPAKEKRIRFRTAVTALLAAAAVGAGTAAVVTATLDSNNGQTVTRNVTVTNAQNTSAATALSVNDVWNRAKDSVVDIKVQTTSQLGQQGEAQGSGWMYSKTGYIVTNDHVVSGASSVTVTFPSTAATYKATVVGADPSTDIAVIKINAPASLLKPLPVGNSSKLVVGDPVVAVGSPFGLDGTVTAGIVSALHRQIDAPTTPPFQINDAIQTDAAINHGNSGGPLFNLRGEVVGVNAQIQSDSGDNAGIGFAIPSDTVKSIADQLISKGNVQHAYLGVSITDIPSAVSGQLGEAAGVAVRGVVAGEPAAKAGLNAATSTRALDNQQYPTGGDVITAFDGQKVTTAAELQSLVDGHQPGDKVQLSVTRNGSSRTVTVTLGTRPAQAS